MKGILLATVAFLFLILTTSVAQIRYSMTNIFSLASLMLNTGVIFLLIAAGIFLALRSRNTNQGYKISGMKGGKSSRKVKDPSKVTSSYPYP